jgi:pyruvate formate lyase activating enzyme
MTDARHLRVGGLVPLSTTDYPGHLAAVIFCQGCPWRCSYCHNPHLLPRRNAGEIGWPAILAFLDKRRGLLDAVVFSGGEPTLQPALPDAISGIRAMGYAVGLHTAGIYPRRLRAVLPLLDWIAMDIKAPFDDYASITGVPGSGARARECMELIMTSGIDHEFRTTVQDCLLPAPKMHALAAELAASGVRNYALQECRAPGDACTKSSLSDGIFRTVASMIPGLTVRRA